MDKRLKCFVSESKFMWGGKGRWPGDVGEGSVENPKRKHPPGHSGGDVGQICSIQIFSVGMPHNSVLWGKGAENAKVSSA